MKITFRILIAVATTTIVGTNYSLAACRPGGAESEQIQCLEKANVTAASRLGPDWRIRYRQYIKTCRAENSGPGSGGRLDRAKCVADKVAAAS